MEATNYEDPVIEEEWCNSRREEVIKYIERQQISHGEIGAWPAWHIAPFVSIWAIESKKEPGWVGWWVICGDLPTDYISADSVRHPRVALRLFSQRWSDIASYMAHGEPYPGATFGDPESWPTLYPLLISRVKIMLVWAENDEIWNDKVT